MTALAAITSMAQSAKAIGPAFQMAGQMMKQAISDLWTWFKSKFIDPVMNGISEIGNALSTAFEFAKDPIGGMKDAMMDFFGLKMPKWGEEDHWKLIEDAVNDTFAKEWDKILHLDEQPEWMTPELWQELQVQSSVMAAQDWDGMLDLNKPKPDWMTNELWETLRTKGSEAAKQEWYTYFDIDKLPSWMTNETYQMIKDNAKDLDDFDWDAAFATDTKPWFLTEQEWLDAKTAGQGSVKGIKDDWDAFIVESDEPEWTTEGFWQGASTTIKTHVKDALSQAMTMIQKMARGIRQSLNPLSGLDGFSMPSFTEIDMDLDPGMIKMAKGGIVSGPKTGFMGMLHGTEAVVPLPDGRSIPVDLGGGGGGNTFNISVDASGITDRTDKRQLAREIGNMIQQEMSRSIGGTTMRGRYS